MASTTSRDAQSNGPSQAPDREGIWASPPAGSRAPDRRVSVAAPGAVDVWLTPPSIDEAPGADLIEVPAAGHAEREAAPPAPESVEWIEIVDDLRRDVVEVVEVVEAETEPSQPQREGIPDAPAGEISATVELAPAATGEVSVSGELVAMEATLSISLEPEWPGNVHVYEITIDARDGTFIGAAARSSNVPGELIRGFFTTGFADIDFIAVYPGPTHHYAWFGAGPLHGFTGSDSRGNVFHTATATVMNPTYVSDPVPADERLGIAAAADNDDGLVEPWFDIDPNADEPREVAVAAPELPDTLPEQGDDEAEESQSEPVVEDDAVDAVLASELEPDVVLPIEEPIAAEELHEPVVHEREAVTDVAQHDAPEPAITTAAATTAALEPPTDDRRDHPPTCRCLTCGSAAFEPVLVTEGPLAGKAFYFRARPEVPDLTKSPTEREPTPT